MERMLSIKELSEMLIKANKKEGSTVANLSFKCRLGLIECQLVGRTYVIAESDAIKYVKSIKRS